MIFSPIGRSPVASLPSPLRRHTKPGEPSASALMRSRLSTKSLSVGESSGALSSAMLSSASWYFDIWMVAPVDPLTGPPKISFNAFRIQHVVRAHQLHVGSGSVWAQATSSAANSPPTDITQILRIHPRLNVVAVEIQYSH